MADPPDAAREEAGPTAATCRRRPGRTFRDLYARATSRGAGHERAERHVATLRRPRLSRRAESLGTENAFVVLAEVNALAARGQGHRLVLHRPTRFPDAQNTSRRRRSQRSEAGKHGYTPSRRDRRIARRRGRRTLACSRGLDVPARRRRRRRRGQAVHRLHDRVGHRLRRRRRGDLPGAGLSDLRVADPRQRRGAGADLPARVA